MTNYPNNLDNSTTLPPAFGDEADPINSLRDAVFAIETELGILPKGAYSDTRTRLDVLEARLNISSVIRVFGTPSAGQAIIWDGTKWIPSTDFLDQPIIFGNSLTMEGTSGIAVSPSGQGRIYYDSSLNKFLISQNGSAYSDLASLFSPGGDLSGSSTNQTVIGLQGREVSDETPTDGYALTWSALNDRWEPQVSSGGFLANGDLDGNSLSQTVVGIQTIPVSDTAPTSNNALVYDGASWSPFQLTLDPEIIGAAFAITLSGGTNVEVSQTVTNPVFTSTKNYTGTSAVLTNNDNSEAKNVLTEFNNNTSFSSDFSYVKNTYNGSVVFTLTAKRLNNTITRVATSTYTWLQRVYFGVGPASSNTESFVKSLANSPLASSRARTFTITAGATQKIYYAYRSAYGLATFSVGGFAGGFFLSTVLTITNNFGFSESYNLYESDNVNLSTVTVVVS